MRHHATDEDVIVFERDATNQLRAAGLVLRQRPDGYEVSNIVPLAAGSLGTREYNDLLDDFLIAEFQQEIHISGETLERWLREEAGWPEDDALALAIQYERGLALLDTYTHEAVPAK